MRSYMHDWVYRIEWKLSNMLGQLRDLLKLDYDLQKL